MKKFVTLACMLTLVFGVAGMASAYSFEDTIDKWSFNIFTGKWSADPNGIFDAAGITASNPLTYTHNINDDVNLPAGDSVTEAWLELDFTNDLTDDYGQIKIGKKAIKWDYREYAKIGYDGSAWSDIGEVDDGQYQIIVDIDWLNVDGLLDVTLKVWNQFGTASAWLDHSRLYGNAVPGNPVPEPSTLLLLGAGVLGLVGLRRKLSK